MNGYKFIENELKIDEKYLQENIVYGTFQIGDDPMQLLTADAALAVLYDITLDDKNHPMKKLSNITVYLKDESSITIRMGEDNKLTVWHQIDDDRQYKCSYWDVKAVVQKLLKE